MAACDSMWLNYMRLGDSQVAKWMLSKGKAAAMGTYDTLLLAFEVEKRVGDAESLWNMILHTHAFHLCLIIMTCMSILTFSACGLKKLHKTSSSVLLGKYVFADMEELGERPDDHTVRRVARAFKKHEQQEKQKLVLRRYLSKWKFVVCTLSR